MKVAIATPVYGDVKWQYAQSLAKLVAYSGRLPCEIDVGMKQCSLVSHGRNLLLEQAIDWGADYILWIDSDQTFPANALERLIGLDRDVVGCNIPCRNSVAPSARKGGQHVFTTESHAKENVVEEVDELGLGLCLVRTAALEPIARPAFRIVYEPDGSFIGEDYYFFRQLGRAGVPVYLDHWLSWHVGHIDVRTLTNQDALLHRAETKLRLAAQKRQA